MRAIVLLLVLIIVVLVAYILVPIEQMQTRAKGTIEQAQSLHASLDVGTVVDGFGSLFEEQEYVLNRGEGAAEQRDIDEVSGADKASSENIYTSCTEEAMLCPDGSVVGRIAPDCTFAPCPGEEGKIIEIQEEEGTAVMVR